MKKKTFYIILLGAVVSSMIAFLFPLSFSNLIENCDSIKIIYINDNLQHSPINEKIFEKDSETFSELKNIFEDYSYRRCVRTIFDGSSMSGNNAGYWLHIYIDNGNERTVIILGGTGEMQIENKIYRMGYWGNESMLGFMEEIVEVAFTD